jgi:predicted Ser/Thr protein kinase
MFPMDSAGGRPPSADDRTPGDRTNAEDTVAMPSAPAHRPEKIGPYRILGVLGTGGMGEVYLAEQERPRRQVALKVMRPGMATPEGLRRFEYEAQALGRLQHEGIARIYEAGTDDAGCGPQPYLAMELIRGRPLTAFADEKRLGLRERLALMVQVCRAVEHAHQKGIIHRDLKPANVLVEETGRPKVLDFGVARAVDRDALTATLRTDAGQLIGTLAYMSPEQAAANPEVLDTRSDVYALGVVCYQLLAGRLPHDLKGKGFPAALRAITDEDPAPLSSINQACRGDLNAIVTKALEKDKARRYQSAAELAADLERYLHDQPVTARSAGTLYQLGKFARRHKALVTAVVVVFLALAAAAAVSVLWAQAAWRAEGLAQGYLANSRAAEQRTQDLLADSYEQAAGLAAQRGAWREAIALIDKALVTERHRGSVPLRLAKVRALLALDDFDHALPEIESLAAAPNLGEHAGSVLLIQGDALLGRDDARAEALIRQASEKGLSDAERAYASALLAESTPEVVAQLRRSLALDPYQPRARSMLALSLLLLARYDDVRLELRAHEALYPEDLNAKVLRAQLVALEGDLPGARAVLDGLESRIKAADLAALRSLVKLLSEFRNPGNVPDATLGMPNLMPHLVAAAPALAGLWPTSPEAAAHGNFFQHFPLPPRLRKLGVRVLSALREAARGKPGPRALDEMAWAARAHPEGTVLFLQALSLFAALRMADAEKVALEAAETPALFSIRQQALMTAVMAEAALYALRHEQPALGRAAGNLRRARELGPLRVYAHRETGINVALRAGQMALARQLLEDWQAEAPDSPMLVKYRAAAEIQAGAYGRALEVIDQGLREQPKDETLLRLKKQAIEKLLQEARPHLPAVPEKGMP